MECLNMAGRWSETPLRRARETSSPPGHSPSLDERSQPRGPVKLGRGHYGRAKDQRDFTAQHVFSWGWAVAELGSARMQNRSLPFRPFAQRQRVHLVAVGCELVGAYAEEYADECDPAVLPAATARD
jgi:hypothetical protein